LQKKIVGAVRNREPARRSRLGMCLRRRASFGSGTEAVIPTMARRWLPGISLALALVLGTACRRDPVVLFHLHVPKPGCEQIWAEKVVDGVHAVGFEEVAKDRQHLDVLTVGVTVPRGWSQLAVRVQATYQADVLVVAEGEKTDISPDAVQPIELELFTCPRGTLPDPTHSCGRLARDGGGDLDGPPADAGGAETADASSGDRPPAPIDVGEPPGCSDPDAGAPPRPVNAMVSQACARYCETMQEFCPAVYADREGCQYACARLGWPAGVPGETNADTIECRITYARSMPATMALRETRCLHASAGSEGCAGLCPAYCRLGRQICGPHFRFPEEVDCIQACNNAVELGPLRGSDVGPALHCRLRTLERAVFQPALCASGAPDTDCGIASCGRLAFVSN
jgi:hypothetical protein